MPRRAFGRLFTFALALSLPACLDFDQYGEGGGAGGESAGGAPAGGGPVGGGGGSAPACPSDNFLPATVCITGSVYDFDDKLGDDWSHAEPGNLLNGCDHTCATVALQESRFDLRTKETAMLDECFASIDILSTTAKRTFLELVPDGEPSGFEIPLADHANNVEISVIDGSVRFEVGATSLPALVLDEGVSVDQLRIQVRANTVVLEAFSGGEQVACSEQERPASVFNQQLRAGFGIQGSTGQEASFDNYGGLAD